MIYSVINGKEISTSKITDIYDVDGNQIDSVQYFNESLDPYVEDLEIASSNWKNSTINERKNVLLELKEVMSSETFKENAVNTIMVEIGKPRIEAETEIDESIGLIDFFIENLNEKIFNKPVPIDPFWDTKKNYIRLQPIGIVGIIKPWNYPISNSLWSIIPALLAGNIIVYKPSENSCACGNILSKAILSCSISKGVFNVLYGDQKTGEKIVENKSISMISFTGSSFTAKAITKTASEHGILRKYSIESGGSDFAIIDKSVDLQFATDGIIWGAFNNAGQVCTSIENVLVPKGLKREFISELLKKIKALIPKKDFGKIQNENLRKKLIEYINSVKADSKINILCGGEIKNGFMIPTVIDCYELDLVNTEVFSNILRVYEYNDDDDIPNIVNKSLYGLGCSIWTKEPESKRINNLINNIEVGMIWINDINISFPEMPWTGIKNSGVGFNLSLQSIQEFSNLKSISIDNNTSAKKDWWYPYGTK